jgi:protein-S-isoprenylcysteine O-methyltransferase
MDKVAVILFVVAWGFAEVRSQARERKRRRDPAASADRGSLVALYASITVGYSLAFAASFSPFGGLPGGQPSWLVVGMACIAGGLWIRHRAMATLAAYFTYQVEIQADHRLIETGPYRRIRHPGYLGQLLVLLGVGVALANWLSIVGLMVPVLAAFLWRIRVEEDALRTEFAGQFERYAARTRRLIPGLY